MLRCFVRFLKFGVPIELDTLVDFLSGLGYRLYLPCLHNFFCNAYEASPIYQEFLGIFLFCLLPPGVPQFGGRCFSFVEVLDGAEGIFDRSFFEYLFLPQEPGT